MEYAKSQNEIRRTCEIYLFSLGQIRTPRLLAGGGKWAQMSPLAAASGTLDQSYMKGITLGGSWRVLYSMAVAWFAVEP